MISIKHRFTCATLCEFDVKTIKEAAEQGSANLDGANLDGANLHGADLRGANLRSANLRGADLDGANLRGANLRSADLRGANLYGADLDGANLDGANLYGANMYGANMYGANLDCEKITKNPLVINGLSYWCLITDGFMRIGCKRFTHKEWSNFSDEQISKMDDYALEFWMQWREPLISMCAKHAGAA